MTIAAQSHHPRFRFAIAPDEDMLKPMNDAMRDMRRSYTLGGLTDAEAGADPIALFTRWFEQAKATCPGEWYESNAMTLATVAADRMPSARVVLLKSIDDGNFVFFTNYLSRKAREMAAHPHAAAVFHWPWLERQVRVEGVVTKIDHTASEEYFRTRPRGSQLGAWVSDQSEPITRAEMDRRLLELEQRYEGRDVPCPPHWGGYGLCPGVMEFWQGRPNRLHDRLEYRRTSADGWACQRLGP